MRVSIHCRYVIIRSLFVEINIAEYTIAEEEGATTLRN